MSAHKTSACEMTPKRRFLSGLLGSVTSVANVEQLEQTGAFSQRDGNPPEVL